MPFGLSHPVIGYFGYCAVKFAGYSLAAHFISQRYQTKRNPFLVGGTRTLIGMSVGVAYYFLLGLLRPHSALLAGLGLVPVRFMEWWLLLWLFYDRRLEQRRKGWRTVVLLTIWSFILDVPALIGFFATGGLSVC